MQTESYHIKFVNVVKDTATSSHHYLVKTTLQYDVSNCFGSNWQEKTIRELNNIDITRFKADLIDSNISTTVNNYTNHSEAANHLHEVLAKVLDKHAPITTKYFKLNWNPWSNAKCQGARRKCRADERLFKKNCSSITCKLYHNACAEAKSVYSKQRIFLCIYITLASK